LFVDTAKEPLLKLENDLLSQKVKRLVLFFTENMSLRGWEARGFLERETALFQRLRGHIHTSFLTYGKRDEWDTFDGSVVMRNRWAFPTLIYKIILPIMYFGELCRADVFKTNQIRGASYAVLLKKLFRKKLVVRFGDLATWAAHEKQMGKSEFEFARNRERYAFVNADVILSPSDGMKAHVVSLHGVNPAKIRVIPHYVDTDLFKPVTRRPEEEREGFRICTVSKNKPSQKNLSSLVEALKGLPDIVLSVVGKAGEDLQLRRQIKDSGIKANILGVVPYRQLPGVLAQADLYVQPSRYEGHPKALLEAMACTLPVIGCDVPGIRNILRHGQTGVLCGTDPASIREAILSLRQDRDQMLALGERARAYVLENASLERVAKMEADVLYEA
jgi:glycosyltransferase involved in cell wall biosynthesis